MMQSGRGPVRGVGKRKIVLRFLSSCEGSISELIDLVTLSFKQLTGMDGNFAIVIVSSGEAALCMPKYETSMVAVLLIVAVLPITV